MELWESGEIKTMGQVTGERITAQRENSRSLQMLPVHPVQRLPERQSSLPGLNRADISLEQEWKGQD